MALRRARARDLDALGGSEADLRRPVPSGNGPGSLGLRWLLVLGPRAVAARGKARLCAAGRLPAEEAPDREHVHLGADEAVDRLLGRAHDGFVLVEARVEQDRDAGPP